MAKKKKTAKLKNIEFNSDPFSDLKGFAVPESEKKKVKPSKQGQISRISFGSFAGEMEMLGVKKLSREADAEDDVVVEDFIAPSCGEESALPTDEEVFLTAMGDLTLNFKDHLPETDLPSQAEPRRLKQLKQGRLTPDASLDLHGCQRSEVVPRLVQFLEKSHYQGWQAVLVITGKGLHSEDGKPILRDEVERFLSSAGRTQVSEWGRAPKQYGGAGALILFLRKKV